MGLFDVHAHLTHPEMVPDVDGVLARAAASGMTSIVSNGLNPTDNAAVLALAARNPLVKPALGLYPVDAVLPEMRALGVDYPRELDHEASAEEAVRWVQDHVDAAFAIGEIGLDGYWVPESLWARQEEPFRALVKLAIEVDKPVIIHTRKREKRAFELLQELGATRVNWHCFGGKVKLARAIAEAGHYLSIPCHVRRSESFTRIVQTLPRDRLLLETDCPYLGPDRDQPNEPRNVWQTAAFMAEQWGVTESAVVAQLTHNFSALFRVDP